VGLGQPQLHAKFEVASFSHCTNIKGESKNLGSLNSTGMSSFSSVWDFMIGLGKPQYLANFANQVASFSRCRNIIGEPQNFGKIPSLRPRPLFLWV